MRFTVCIVVLMTTALAFGDTVAKAQCAGCGADHNREDRVRTDMQETINRERAARQASEQREFKMQQDKVMKDTVDSVNRQRSNLTK